MLVAVTAVGATAWLILRQASQQITESATASQQVQDLVHDTLLEYGQTHGTWEGVPSTVVQLTQRTGQRIHLASETGVVVADSDQLAGRTPRPLGAAITLVDPRPTIDVTSADTKEAAGIVLKMIADYRNGVRFAACLTRGGWGIRMSEGAFRVPQFVAVDAGPAVVENCRSQAAESNRDAALDRERVIACVQSEAVEPPAACFARVFIDQTNDVAAVPLTVTLGARGEEPPPLQAGPMIAAAAGVAVLAILGTALLSHRVLRPIERLTEAAGRLGRGDLTSRVSIVGRDEVAELGRPTRSSAARSASGGSSPTSRTSCVPRWPTSAAIWRR
jgi:two-component system, OmpR family, sensor histidine kinase BaeS